MDANRVLVKLRPSGALRAAESRVNLRPLYNGPQAGAAVFGAGAEPQWFLADLPDGAATPWDLAHARLAGQLGVAEADVVFAEPDIAHRIYQDANEERPGPGRTFAVGSECDPIPPDNGNGKPLGPAADLAWHLGPAYTQLDKARATVEFTAPRTRIAHLDTGYYRAHETVPQHIVRDLERN